MRRSSPATKRDALDGLAGNFVSDPDVPGLGTAALLLVVALATRAAMLGDPVYHVDEQLYLLVGDRLLHGAVPYVDLWDRKPIGLFLLYAGLRLLPGDGVLAYQLAATAVAAATAWVVAAGARRLGAGAGAALAAGCAYLIWLPLLSGGGGQSPVFYNLAVALGGVLTLRLPALAAARRRGAIVASGAAACLLAGLAIQVKYTPFVEGAAFGLAHLFFLRRAGGRWLPVAAAALLWVVLGLLPTLLAIAWFAARGDTTFRAFWFANFASVALRRGYPAAKIAARLAGTWAQLLPLVAGAALTWRRRRRPESVVAVIWLSAALVGYAIIGAFFDHYALPLVAPLAMLAAPAFRDRRVLVATLGLGLAVLMVKTVTRPREGDGIRRLAQVVQANSRSGCPYVFAGDSVVYLLAHACIPTPYAFPSSLAYDPERGATGIDEAAEVRRIMGGQPPVVVTLDRPLAPWNAASVGVVAAALARDYRLSFAAPRAGGHELVYVRRGRRPPPEQPASRLPAVPALRHKGASTGPAPDRGTGSDG
jgi:hypothetical protein